MTRSDQFASPFAGVSGERLGLCAPSDLLRTSDFAMPGHAVAPSDAAVGAAWSRTAQRGLPRWRLMRVLDFIDDNLAREIKLDDLARTACLSPHHFSELFRQSTGVSPYRYVVARRIECAKVLLRSSVLGVLEVAIAVGFSDQSHFSKVFRRSTGTTPGMYRAGA